MFLLAGGAEQGLRSAGFGFMSAAALTADGVCSGATIRQVAVALAPGAALRQRDVRFDGEPLPSD